MERVLRNQNYCNGVRKHSIYDAEQSTVLSGGLRGARTNKTNFHGRIIIASLNMHRHR